MIVEAQVTIDGSKEAIWARITDIENASRTVSGIEKVEILERPMTGLVGLKWRETRKLFGKTATETMWITDAAENEYYKTRAESHGFIYICTFTLSEQGGGSLLTMTHESKPQGFVAKTMSVLLGFILKGAIRKAIQKDLNDIKAAIEQQGGG
jgi:carbon monoxide dehydrogenase subunit G